MGYTLDSLPWKFDTVDRVLFFFRVAFSTLRELHDRGLAHRLGGCANNGDHIQS